MIIKTKFDKKVSTSYLKRQITTSIITLSILTVLVVGVAIWDIVDYGFKMSLYTICAMICILTLITSVGTYIYVYKKYKKTDKISSDNTFNYFEFDESDNSFSVTCEINSQEQSKVKVFFNQLAKILETKEYYYMFLNSQMLYVIPKKDLDAEQNIYVGNLLKQRVANYKVKR